MKKINLELIKWFIKERESIRMGTTTTDHVLLNSRFCNVHREHDKVSQWIFNNTSTISQVMISRLVNRIDLLTELYELQWATNRYIKRDGAVTNSAAYQFYPPKGKTMRDIITDISDNSNELSKSLKDNQHLSIKDLSLLLSKKSGYNLHFYWMMVVLDCIHLGYITTDPNSEPYAGPGGHKTLKALGMDLCTLAKELDVYPYTAEHVACEVRKYVDRYNNGIPNNRKRHSM